jgi:hypothetical protein
MFHMNTQTTRSPHLIAVVAAAALGLLGCLDTEPLDDADPEIAESTASSEINGPITYIHRAYKPATGEHFYTTSSSEIFFGGYQFEFPSYYGLESGWVAGWVPFYRCYWSAANKHLYTTQANCEGVAWNEGQLGFISNTQATGTVPLYRLYQPSNYDHLYTTSIDEVWFAWSIGYYYEGISGYVYPKP